MPGPSLISQPAPRTRAEVTDVESKAVPASDVGRGRVAGCVHGELRQDEPAGAGTVAVSPAAQFGANDVEE